MEFKDIGKQIVNMAVWGYFFICLLGGGNHLGHLLSDNWVFGAGFALLAVGAYIKTNDIRKKQQREKILFLCEKHLKKELREENWNNAKSLLHDLLSMIDDEDKQ